MRTLYLLLIALLLFISGLYTHISAFNNSPQGHLTHDTLPGNYDTIKNYKSLLGKYICTFDSSRMELRALGSVVTLRFDSASPYHYAFRIVDSSRMLATGSFIAWQFRQCIMVPQEASKGIMVYYFTDKIDLKRPKFYIPLKNDLKK